ncbi:MAG: PIN domain-containing protein [Thermoanaerobaculia bacterium]
MIAVDTNVLVRLVVGDDQEQVGRVIALLERTREAEQQWFVAVPVLCELVWVLDSVFGVPRRAIASTLDALLEERLYQVESREAVGEALDRYRRARGDFVDYLIAALARRHGAALTYTFDRALRREPGFALL